MFKNKFLFLEILIILVTVVILFLITYQQFALAKAKSRDVQRKSDLNEFAKVVKLYFADYGKLPSNEFINGIWGETFVDDTGYVYAVSVPSEKYGKDEYCYQIADDGVSFKLSAELENKNDLDCKKDGNLCNGIKYCYTDIINANEVTD